jgi:hypothetical protein|nr:MAG TPA: hypothetical protein [Inoviridae sp.]
MKIYLPQDSTYNKCYVVQSEGVIRGYEEVPQINRTVNYRDYYIKSDYIYRDGIQTFGSYSTTPTCLASSLITNDYWYRLDLTNILINFTIIVIFGLYFPWRIFKSLFGRRFL